MGYRDLETEELSFMDKVKKNWNGFRAFMWNPEEKTVMGRGSKSWGMDNSFKSLHYLQNEFRLDFIIILTENYIRRLFVFFKQNQQQRF